MRLRLVVKRHSLPETRILLNVSLDEDPTIYKLLLQVNDLVPLESDCWGLEDYAVELRASDGTAFEALHYQPVSEVLSHDEVVYIRPLLTPDIQRRRLSGRLQISTDGRHLVDGVPFGFPSLRSPRNRPAVEIPPRKRRKLLHDEGQDFGSSDDDVPLQITQFGEPQDDEHDSDFSDHGAADDMEDDDDIRDEQMSDISEAELTALYHDLEDEPEVKTAEESDLYGRPDEASEGDVEEESFENDLSPEEHSNLPSHPSQDELDTPRRKNKAVNASSSPGGFSDAEFSYFTSSDVADEHHARAEAHKQQLLGTLFPALAGASGGAGGACPANLYSDNMDDNLAIVDLLACLATAFPGHGMRALMDSLMACRYKARRVYKRLRRAADPCMSYNGVKRLYRSIHSEAPPVQAFQFLGNQMEEMAAAVEEEREEEEVEEEGGKEEEGKEEENEHDDEDESSYFSADEDSQDASSSDEQDEAESSSDASADAHSAKGQAAEEEQQDSSSDSDSSSETSSSDDSDDSSDEDGPEEVSSKPPAPAHASGPTQTPTRPSGVGKPALAKPGTGQQPAQPSKPATNGEVHDAEAPKPQPGKSKTRSRNARRRALKQALKAAAAESQNQDTVETLEERKRALLAALGNTGACAPSDTAMQPTAAPEAAAVTTTTAAAPPPLVPVAAAAADTAPQANEAEGDADAWRSKINYSAVECVEEGVELSEPPFPFVQRWDPQQRRCSRGEKRKRRGDPEHHDYHYHGDHEGYDGQQQQQEHADGQQNYSVTKRLKFAEAYSHGDVGALNYDDEDDGANDASAEAEMSAGESQLSDLDDLPSLPADLSTLPALEPGSAEQGMVITWKQWVLSEATSWQPQLVDVSAIVAGVSDDGAQLQVVLARRDRAIDRPEKTYDEETGERIYGRFEVPDLEDDDDDHDDDNNNNDNGDGAGAEKDGWRTLQFADLIEPRVQQRPLGSAREGAEGHADGSVLAPDSQAAWAGATAEKTGPDSLPEGQIRTLSPPTGPSDHSFMAETAEGSLAGTQTAEQGKVAAAAAAAAGGGGHGQGEKELTNAMLAAGAPDDLESPSQQLEHEVSSTAAQSGRRRERDGDQAALSPEKADNEIEEGGAVPAAGVTDEAAGRGAPGPPQTPGPAVGGFDGADSGSDSLPSVGTMWHTCVSKRSTQSPGATKATKLPGSSQATAGGRRVGSQKVQQQPRQKKQVNASSSSSSSSSDGSNSNNHNNKNKAKNKNHGFGKGTWSSQQASPKVKAEGGAGSRAAPAATAPTTDDEIIVIPSSPEPEYSEDYDGAPERTRRRPQPGGRAAKATAGLRA